MRLLNLGLLLLLSLLVYTLVWGKNGLIEHNAIASEITIQHTVNSALQKRNDEMYAEIEDLRQGLDAIEERARQELGMVKTGETFYRIVTDNSQ